MKRIFSYLLLLLLAIAFAACEKDLVEEPVMDLKKASVEKNNGFDQWGYNWHAHQFNGYLMNAWFGDELYPDAPWYKKEPPFDGDILAYQEAHPEVLDYPFWGYGDMKVIMHWNDACISRQGEYRNPILDSEAWITFHYSQGEGVNKWSQHQKFVAAKSSYTLEVDFYDDSGEPVLGRWYTAEGDLVGLYYLWPDRVLIQLQNAGNIPGYLLTTFKSPICPGLGKYKK